MTKCVFSLSLHLISLSLNTLTLLKPSLIFCRFVVISFYLSCIFTIYHKKHHNHFFQSHEKCYKIVALKMIDTPSPYTLKKQYIFSVCMAKRNPKVLMSFIATSLKPPSFFLNFKSHVFYHHLKYIRPEAWYPVYTHNESSRELDWYPLPSWCPLQPYAWHYPWNQLWTQLSIPVSWIQSEEGIRSNFKLYN